MLTEEQQKVWNQEETWTKCLNLWHTISSMPSQSIDVGPTDFKNNILEMQGAGRQKFGCPFCEAYYYSGKSDGSRCLQCPINQDQGQTTEVLGCYYTPFKNWEHHLSDGRYHDQQYASEFYNYLKNLHARLIGNEPLIKELSEWIDTNLLAKCIVEALIDNETEVTIDNAKELWRWHIGGMDDYLMRR